MISDDARPRLRPHVHLRWDAVRAAWVLLSPERATFPDPVALEILRALDGRRTVGELADALAARYQAPRARVAADVTTLVSRLARDGLVLTR